MLACTIVIVASFLAAQIKSSSTCENDSTFLSLCNAVCDTDSPFKACLTCSSLAQFPCLNVFPTTTQFLDLFGANLTYIPSGSFNNGSLLSLLSLVLDFNPITSLPPGCFVGLRNLQVLSLVANRLTYIDASAFQGLFGLETLYMSNNQMTFLPENLFSGSFNVSSLTQLTLKNNPWTAVPLINGLISLETLDLSGCEISYLMASSLSNLSSLISVDLSSNVLSSIENGAFNDLSQLQMLYLEKNSLEVISSGTFLGLSHLQELTLFGQPSGLQLQGNAFEGLPSITSVYLTGQVRSAVVPSFNVSLNSASFSQISQFYCGASVLQLCQASSCNDQCGIGSTCYANGALDSASTFTCSNTPPSSSQSGLSAGDVAGIVIGTIAGVLLFVAIAIFALKKRRTREYAQVS